MHWSLLIKIFRFLQRKWEFAMRKMSISIRKTIFKPVINCQLFSRNNKTWLLLLTFQYKTQRKTLFFKQWAFLNWFFAIFWHFLTLLHPFFCFLYNLKIFMKDFHDILSQICAIFWLLETFLATQKTIFHLIFNTFFHKFKPFLSISTQFYSIFCNEFKMSKILNSTFTPRKTKTTL